MGSVGKIQIFNICTILNCSKSERQTRPKPATKTGAKNQKQIAPVAKESHNQTKLTSFFPIRRSERRPKLESEALQQKLIDERLLADHDQDLGLEIKQIPEKVIYVLTSFIHNVCYNNKMC